MTHLHMTHLSCFWHLHFFCFKYSYTIPYFLFQQSTLSRPTNGYSPVRSFKLRCKCYFMHFQKQYVYKPVKVYKSSVLILIQALIMNIMNGSVPSWRKKAYDAGDRESNSCWLAV